MFSSTKPGSNEFKDQTIFKKKLLRRYQWVRESSELQRVLIVKRPKRFRIELIAADAFFKAIF